MVTVAGVRPTSIVCELFRSSFFSLRGMVCDRPSSGSTEAQTRKNTIRINAMSFIELEGGSTRYFGRRSFKAMQCLCFCEEVALVT